MVVILVRGYRWRIFLKPVSDVSLRLTSNATLIGCFGNNALPMRLGEVLRSYIIARRISVPVSQVFGSVIVERVVDILSALVLIAGLPFLGVIPTTVRQPLIWLIIFSACLVVVAFWLARRKNGIPFLKNRMKEIADNLLLGFNSLSQTQHYIKLLISTVILWFLYLMSIHVTQYAIGLELSLADSYVLLLAITISMMFAAAPGNVGTYHAAVVISLTTVFDVDLPKAQAAAVVLHAIAYIPYTIFGALLYVRSNLHIRDVRLIEGNPAADGD